MNKHKIIAALILVLLLAAGYYVSTKQSKKPQPNNTQQNSAPAINSVSVTITEIHGDYIVATGSINKEAKRFEFALTNDTVYKNNVIIIPKEAKTTGKFNPVPTEKKGNPAEMKTEMSAYITVKEDLNTTNKATATEIKYTTYDTSAVR